MTIASQRPSDISATIISQLYIAIFATCIISNLELSLYYDFVVDFLSF
jgi:hypothetical protein